MPYLQTTHTNIHATSADSRPGLTLQTRPLGEGITQLFKIDPQKKLDKEYTNKATDSPQTSIETLC